MKKKDVTVEDRFVLLEDLILQNYLSKGFKLFKDKDENDKEWTFQVFLRSSHKIKVLEVITYFKNSDECVSVYSDVSKTLEEMYDKAFEFFKIEENEDAKN